MAHPGRPVLLLLLVSLLAACDKIAPPGMSAEDPPVTPVTPAATPPPATQAAPAAAAPASRPAAADPAVAEFVGLRGPKPPSWEAYAPTSGMRAANYRVPGAAGEAELVVFYFGQGMGGGIQENIDRWSGQFVGADRGPVEPKVDVTEVDGMKVTLVELAGGYMGMGSTPAPDQLFLAAIVEAPAGNVFIRLVGPADTVEDERDAFGALIDGLRRAGG